jgi:esterase/lipase
MRKPKVIFLPGFSGGKRDFFLIKLILKKDFEPLFFKYDTWLKEPIEKISKKLRKFIENLNLKKGEQIFIVGLSAGGIVAEHYCKFLDKGETKKLVTVCSPLKGTYLSGLLSKKRPGLKQLKKDSNFLKNLEEGATEIKQLNIWCYLDPIVPGTSGRGDNPLRTFFFLHWIIQYWPPVIIKIKNFFKK